MGSDGATGEYCLDTEGTSIYGLLVSLPHPYSSENYLAKVITAVE